jgi:hypothetical protein
VIETDEMIHMSMGHKYLPDLEQTPRIQGLQVPQVEKQRFPAVLYLYENARVAERIVDQAGIKHGRSSTDDAKPQSWGRPFPNLFIF